MTRRCDILLDRSIMYGNKVSHAMNHTLRRFLPNLQNITLHSDALKADFKFRLASRTIKTIEFKGGFDTFLLKTKNAKLTPKALKLKKKIYKLQNNLAK